MSRKLILQILKYVMFLRGGVVVPNCDASFLGGFQRQLTLIPLQEYCDTNWSRIVIRIGVVYTTFSQEEGIFLQKYRDRTGRCIMIFSKVSGSGVGIFDEILSSLKLQERRAFSRN